MNNLFEKAPIHKAYFQLALPVVFSMVASMAYNLADTFFVSQTQNADMVAGVSICTPLFSLMLAFGDIFGIGGSALISRLLGEGNKKQSARISSFCFYAAIVFSVIVAVIMLVFERSILALMGATNATYQHAAAFYRIMAIGGGAIIVSLVPGNLLRTEGLAVQSMIGTISGVVITIILDPLFIFIFGLGAGGAALATVVGYLISTIILTFYTIRQGKVLKVKPDLAKVNLKAIIPLFAIGIPASITNLMQSFGTALLNNYLAPYGAKPVAALGISLKIYLVVMLFMIGFAFGAQPLIGYNYGSQDKKDFMGLFALIY
ncbi:hypothetical protein LFYK43_06520 [Ligilactobacillus salitolerans]|uniref:MATE family efflux transporter n=1 Tax=Ligilactobacillus salitolerans TaxID=1808352 RepID=A0A401IRM5_9LACO|nr:hypothetical protein LFYK43_06520 [Ligilactobacillus salitolerans]